MEWIERLNHAVAYIDENLCGPIDYAEISRITVSPMALFQRFFVLATGITLAEYIRRRKLAGALRDLQETEAKVIDIAMKYGYESSDAFCVAFKRLYGTTPSKARKTSEGLKSCGRIFFSLTVTYVKGENDMVLLNIDNYRYYEPLFEGARVILNYLGESYMPEYIQGISGAAFKIAGGCPSRPTCVCDMWPTDLFRLLGYEVSEYPCVDENGKDISGEMIEAVKRQIDGGKPALVWHAFSNAEFDVVCGYDEDAKHFIGRGTFAGNADDYAREPWGRAATCDVCPAIGAVIVGEKVADFNSREAEIRSIVNAVKHARRGKYGENPFEVDGIAFYMQWAAEYAAEGKERDVADMYCYAVYASVRRAAVRYLYSISRKYEEKICICLECAAGCFEQEADELDKAEPYLSWNSP